MRDETTSVKAELRSDLSDGELMNRLGRGDSHALGEIYQRYVGVVRTALTRSAPELPRAQREELTQDVFVALLEQARRYRDEERLRAFLYGISVRKARMWRRQTWLRQHLLLRHQDLPVGMAARPQGGQVESLAARQDVMQALSHLPEAQREVLLLHAEGFSGEEIADQLHIRPKTVWTRLHRARSALGGLAIVGAVLMLVWSVPVEPDAASREASSTSVSRAQSKASRAQTSTVASPSSSAAKGKPQQTSASDATFSPSPPPLAAPQDIKTERLAVRSAAHAGDRSKLTDRSRERSLDGTGALAAARKQVIAGELEAAEAALHAYLTVHADDGAAWSLLADCLRKAGRYAEAVEAYRKVLSVGTESERARARFLAASVLQDRLHDAKGVVALLDGYGRAHWMAPEANVRLARALIDLGQRERAEQLLQEVMGAQAPAHVAQEAARLLSSLRAPPP